MDLTKNNSLTVTDVDTLNNLSNVNITPEFLATPEFANGYKRLSDVIELLTAIQKAIKTQITGLTKEQYIRTKDPTIVTDEYKFTFVPGTLQARFDSAKFKVEHPKMYDEYTKSSSVAERLVVTKR